MCLTLAGFAFLVTVGNLTDYESNFAFVQHVLSMDTTFPGNALMYRAITTPALWHVAYWLIIGGEGLTFLFFLMGAVALWRARNESARAFARAKKWAYVGATMGFLVWFLGFMVVGGEWFAMWQSKIWNGQEAAFRLYMAILGVLIFINQPDAELEQPGAHLRRRSGRSPGPDLRGKA
jgi:predicted small integral membrane protein